MSNHLQSFPAFIRAVGERLEAGSREYGDKSFAREPGELLGELQQEALDLAGWGFVLWRRLEAMREALRSTETQDAITLTLPHKDLDVLQALADTLGRAPSEVVRHAIYAWRSLLLREAERARREDDEG